MTESIPTRRASAPLPGHHRRAGQLADRRALLQAIAERAVHVRRRPERGNRLIRLVGQIALARVPLQERRSLRRGEPVRVAERSAVLAGGLPVRAERGRLLSGARSESQHRRGIPRRVGVVRESRQIVLIGGPCLELCECGPVQLDPNCERHRILDRQARELVSEGQHAVLGCQHSGGEGVGEQVRRGMCKRFEQAGVSAGREDGQGVEERSCVGAEPRGTGEHGISNGLGHLVGERRQHLGDEERVPGGQPVQLVGICGARIGEDADGTARERTHPDAANAGNRGQASEDDAIPLPAEACLCGGGNRATWSRSSLPTAKYFDWGCAK